MGLTGGHNAFPILTGNEQWKPGQVMVFYALTTKYYPVQPAVSAGFVFNFNGSPGIAIPGPSGVFQRVRVQPRDVPGGARLHRHPRARLEGPPARPPRHVDLGGHGGEIPVQAGAAHGMTGTAGSTRMIGTIPHFG